MSEGGRDKVGKGRRKDGRRGSDKLERRRSERKRENERNYRKY